MKQQNGSSYWSLAAELFVPLSQIQLMSIIFVKENHVWQATIIWGF